MQVYKPDELNELMASCDYVVLALPATPATYQLVDEHAIAALKPNAVLINVGRGTTIDEQALTTGSIRIMLLLLLMLVLVLLYYNFLDQMIMITMISSPLGGQGDAVC